MTADFWLRLAVASLVILAIWNALLPAMILGAVGKWLDRHQWLGKPLGQCPPCAASFHGTWVWLLTGGRLPELPLFILALSGAMVIVSRNLLR